MLELLNQFQSDPTVVGLAILVALDVVLGVLSAFKRGVFKFVIIADFLRADVLGKLLPYYGIWVAVHVGGDLMIGDLGLIEESTGALALAAIGASVLNSVKELGLSNLPEPVAANDPTTPG
jgi:hypothetical protein